MGVYRFFLALAVLFAHAGGSWSGSSFGDGRLAVETFFMISGFYMALVWSEKYQHLKTPIKLFYISRALRIYPLYFLVLTLTGLLACYLWSINPQFPVANPFKSELDLSVLVWVYFTQITLIGMNASIFYGLQDYWIVPVAWSLGLELSFYFFAPFLFSRKKLMAIFFMTLIVARCAIYILLDWKGSPIYNIVWSYRFFPFELPFFIAGIFAYQLSTKLPLGLIRLITRQEFLLSTLLILIGGLSYFSKMLSNISELAYWCY